MPQGYQYGLLVGTPEKPAFFRQKREGAGRVDRRARATASSTTARPTTVLFTGRAVLRRYRGTQLNDESVGSQMSLQQPDRGVHGQGKATPAAPPPTRPAACAPCSPPKTRRTPAANEAGACAHRSGQAAPEQQDHRAPQVRHPRGRSSSPAGGMASDSRLEVRHLKKSYGSRKVVKDVSLAVQQGRGRGPARPQWRGQDHLVST